MKASALKYTILTWVSWFTMLILLLIPFHAFLTVWGSSLVGHYTALRLWKEVLLFLSSVGVIILLVLDKKIRSHTLTRRLVWTIFAYIGLALVWAIIAYAGKDVTAKAVGYGLIVDLRFPIFFLVCWAVALRLTRLRLRWQWLVLWPATIVVIFGLLQIFLLPHDFLKHFGYGPSTIPPFETINHNQHYYRIMSTLRGANPLGAYLIIPISLLTTLLISTKRTWRQAILYVGSFIVLLFTFSRSAWVGAALAIATILFINVKSDKARKNIGIAVVVFAVIAGIVFLSLRHNSSFENYVFHTQTNSTVKSTSDQGHTSALRSGLHDIEHDPLGQGPGTAGPASVYNTGQPTRIAENYYIQIGQELGWVGMALFILINVGVGYLLWLRRSDPLALCLFASLIGLTFVNMLSHAWADDTLAYLWWGLAGIAMAPIPKPPKTDEKE